MSMLQTLRSKVAPIVVRTRCRTTRNRLQRHPHEAASLLSNALGIALDDDFSQEEATWMDNIEGIRNRLLQSTTPVEIRDFGAVSSEIELDSETMEKGRMVTRTVGDMCASSAKPPFWARFLFSLVRQFKPNSGLELGTCLGVSASYQAAAMRLNGNGRLVTLEGSDSLAKLARETLSTLHLDNVEVVVGGFHETLDATLARVAPIDYAFIDGHHHEESTLLYFDKIRNRSADRACLIFDDISWSRGMRRAWNVISAHKDVAVAADLYTVGVAIVEKPAR